MNLNEAMGQLMLGKEVGRHKDPKMRLKIVDPKEYENLDEESIRKLGDTVILDLGYIEDNKFTVYEGIREEKIYTWGISIDDINAEDFYVYEEGKNLTSEEAYEQIINGQKVYNDEIFGDGVHLSLYDYSPALFNKDGRVIINKDGSTKWLPKTDEDFENRYYVIE